MQMLNAHRRAAKSQADVWEFAVDVLAHAGEASEGATLIASPGLAMATDLFVPGASFPCWDHEYRVLRVGRRTVKRYRRPSPNQELVLAAFQEEGWPRRIDDPLPPRGEQHPKCRLHDTIKWLNRRHEYRLIRFLGDGTGEGVCWEFLSEAPLVIQARRRLRIIA